MGAALAPLTAAGIAGVEAADAGAASGVMNAAQQLGASLGVSILATVVAGSTAASGAPRAGLALHGAARTGLADGVATALSGSVVLLALGLAVIVAAVHTPRAGALARAIGAVR